MYRRAPFAIAARAWFERRTDADRFAIGTDLAHAAH